MRYLQILCGLVLFSCTQAFVFPNLRAQECEKASVCNATACAELGEANCHCSGNETKFADLDDRPQIVYLTFDDAFTAIAEEDFYRVLFNGTYKNPNGCNIRATHFITQSYTDYELVNRYWHKGHEIAALIMKRKIPSKNLKIEIKGKSCRQCDFKTTEKYQFDSHTVDVHNCPRLTSDQKGKLILGTLIKNLRKISAENINEHPCTQTKNTNLTKLSNEESVKLIDMAKRKRFSDVNLSELKKKNDLIICGWSNFIVGSNEDVVECHEKFSTIDRMKRHIRLEHLKLNECMLCSHCFSAKSDLIYHIENK